MKSLHLYTIPAADVLLFALAHILAYIIRFDLMMPGTEWANAWRMLPMVLVTKLLVFWGIGVYRSTSRLFTLADLVVILEATVLSSMIIFSVIMAVYEFQGFSRGVFVLDWILTIFLVGGSRLAIRRYSHYFSGISVLTGTRQLTPVVIIGDADAGQKLLQDIRQNPALNYRVKGFIDGNGAKAGTIFHGVRVLGRLDDLPAVAEQEGIRLALVAIPYATGIRKRRIFELCTAAGIECKTLPNPDDPSDSRVSARALRPMNYEDFLGRPPVRLEEATIQEAIQDRVVLVTGAGGTIGAEICRQLIRFLPARLVLVDSSEAALYRLHMELKQRIGYLDYAPVLAQVTDRETMNLTFKRYRPDVVFHAAGYRNVPMLEKNPWQAVRQNILGTQILLEASIAHQTGRVLLLSTDKAVKPVSVMGASFRCCELMMHAYTGDATRISAVRLGNVAGTSGSVIPLFQQQIEAGGPVTVTHPEATRYFMTAPEAGRLILQAGAMGTGGEIYQLEMGTPTKIADLAQDLIRLSSKVPGQDIEISYTSLRPGEKLCEDLIADGEGLVGTAHEKILEIRSGNVIDSHGSFEDYQEWLTEHLGQLYSVAETYDSCRIKDGLKEIVTEYAIQDVECVF